MVPCFHKVRKTDLDLAHFEPISGVLDLYLAHFEPITGSWAWIWPILSLFWWVLDLDLADFEPLWGPWA